MIKQKTIDKWNTIMKYRTDKMVDEVIAIKMGMRKSSIHNLINRNKGKLNGFVEAHRIVRDVESVPSTQSQIHPEFQGLAGLILEPQPNPLGTVNGLDVVEASFVSSSNTGEPSPTFYGDPTVIDPSSPVIDGPIFGGEHIPPTFIPDITIPTYNEIYQFIHNNPEHVYHDYFTKTIKRGDCMVEQIYVNQALITKILNLILDMNRT